MDSDESRVTKFCGQFQEESITRLPKRLKCMTCLHWRSDGSFSHCDKVHLPNLIDLQLFIQHNTPSFQPSTPTHSQTDAKNNQIPWKKLPKFGCHQRYKVMLTLWLIRKPCPTHFDNTYSVWSIEFNLPWVVNGQSCFLPWAVNENLRELFTILAQLQQAETQQKFQCSL